jgi:N-acetylmuramoyl-L-alanine amidase
MKVAIVVGHHAKAKGAYSEFLKDSEFDFYNKVVDWYKRCLNGSGDIYLHDENIGGYITRIKNTARKLNTKNYDLVIELHFNAATPQANGCETLYYFQSKKGREYAFKFSQIVHEQTGIKVRNNGLKALTHKGDRGFASVFYPSAPTILIEPFFGSNKKDCELIRDYKYMARILKIYVDAL